MRQKLSKCEILNNHFNSCIKRVPLFVRAEAATKSKFEKVAEIKRLNAQLVTIKK